MFNQKDIIAQNIKILNDKDVSIISNNDEDYIFSALTVEGGGVFKKGLAIGIQSKMAPGLMIYDTENFYGYSEKYGLCLLSNHNEYNELVIPDSVFENKKDRNVLQPADVNVSDNFKNLKETEKIENKNLNIDLQIKDSNNFYIVVPEIYGESKFILTFDISYIIDLNTVISNLSLCFINRSNKPVYFKITNDECYYEDNFSNEIEKNSVNKINVEVIDNNYLIFTKKTFRKN
jgi:hypothetical protein